MPSKSIFRQPGAQHFQVVHRSQRDPLIHDPEASKHVLKPIHRGNPLSDVVAYRQTLQGKSRAELEQLLVPSHLAHDKQRENIGEAALYGVYFDDTDYDYMQHLKPVGVQEDGVDSIWLEGPANSKGKGKKPLSLLDLPEETLPSTYELPRNYESQQNIPSSIAGFQPDMDPHLRQVLEALEDDEFVDEGLEDDFFEELVVDGERGSDEGIQYAFREEGLPDGTVEEEGSGREDEVPEESWQARFARFKESQKSGAQDQETSDVDAYSEGGDTIGTLPQISVIGGKKRRRKGASDASGYSMSSSSMWRNDHLTVLDERFDQIQHEYESSEDEDEGTSLDDLDEAPDLVASRADFDSMMDEFLDKYEVIQGRMRPTLPGSATEKLNTVRKALGEAKIRDLEDNDSEDEDILMPLDIDDKKDGWDCETVLTTYSNLENHPRLIRARSDKPVPRIRLDPRTGLPSVVEAMPKKSPPTDSSATDDEVEQSRPVRVTVTRPKNERAEDKRARKQAVKADRQARRSDKKATKERFSNEVRQQVQSLTQKETAKVRKL